MAMCDISASADDPSTASKEFESEYSVHQILDGIALSSFTLTKFQVLGATRKLTTAH